MHSDGPGQAIANRPKADFKDLRSWSGARPITMMIFVIAWPPLRKLQNGQGNAKCQAGYTNATALTTGSKKLSSLLVGRVHIPVVTLAPREP